MADTDMSLALRKALQGLLLLLAALMLPLQPAAAQAAPAPRVSISPLFISLSDAMDAVKSGRTPEATQRLQQIQTDLSALSVTDAALKAPVEQSLRDALAQPGTEQLGRVASSLRTFEKALNPVDFTDQRAEFKRQMSQAYQALDQAIAQATPASSLTPAYQQFNSIWLNNERVVRNTSMSHYGAIEVAMALMRVAIETQPLDISKVQEQSVQLKKLLDSYNQGTALATVPPAAASAGSLAAATQLLRQGLADFQGGRIAEGQNQLTRFIQGWPAIEGEVSTRQPSLYDQIETQLPVILAHGAEASQQTRLQSLIGALDQINPQAQYTAVDAMLILLREGLEALLVILALLTALKAANQTTGAGWIFSGVLAGLLASVISAIALQQLFPATSSNSKREMLEGFIGIVTVCLMLVVGAWLHSKSSLQSWNQYIRKHMNRALTTGSLASLFSLSFLSVFREGAETILFYTGILPQIAFRDFLLGIGMAVALLLLVGVVLFKTSIKIPISKMFMILTWTIYALGFKILGVSLHTLQLTGYLPTTTLQESWLQNTALGLYPTVETLGGQALYLVVIALVQFSIQRNITALPPSAKKA